MSETFDRNREIIAVRYGTRETTLREIYYNYDRYGEPDGPAVMDYYFWIVRDDRQTIVIDTGFSERSGSERGRTRLIDPGDALRVLGVDPATVRRLVLTHAHYDHTGNLGLFPNAEIVMSQTEYDFIAGPLADKPQLAAAADARDNAELLALADAGRVRTVGPTAWLAPGLQLIEFPGHSPGQMGLLVERGERPVLLSSDAVHYYDELEHDRPFEVAANLTAMYQSFREIRALLAATGATLVPGHDPAVMKRFPPVAGPAGDFAVRID